MSLCPRWGNSVVRQRERLIRSCKENGETYMYNIWRDFFPCPQNIDCYPQTITCGQVVEIRRVGTNCKNYGKGLGSWKKNWGLGDDPRFFPMCVSGGREKRKHEYVQLIGFLGLSWAVLPVINLALRLSYLKVVAVMSVV